MDKMEFKPFTEETINDIIESNPDLTREYIVSKHEEIYYSITDDQVNEMLEKMRKYEDSIQDDGYIEWDFCQVKKLLISIKESKAKLGINSEIVMKRIFNKLKEKKDDNINQ